MKITNGKDFWAGLMFIILGLFFLVISTGTPELIDRMYGSKLISGYPIGTAVRMGPAYFPTVLGGILAVLGAVIFFRSFVSSISTPLRVFPFRPWILAGGLALSVLAMLSFDVRNHGTAAMIAHMVLSGIGVVMIFAAFGPKSLWVLLGAVVLFGYLLKPAGLILATGVLLFISALGGHEFKTKEIAILFVVLAIFSYFAFVRGLGLPMNVWPLFLE